MLLGYGLNDNSTRSRDAHSGGGLASATSPNLDLSAKSYLQSGMPNWLRDKATGLPILTDLGIERKAFARLSLLEFPSTLLMNQSPSVPSKV